MNLAIIPSAYRTIFFHALARTLERQGHQVFWLSPNGRWARWLYRQGVPRQMVLEVTREGEAWANGTEATADDLTRLRKLETMSRLTMNDIIIMDPLLVRRPRARALRYLGTCERLVREFLHRNDIELVFGEQTWAIELLTGQICRERGVPHLVPHMVRIPDVRFGFFEGHTQANLVQIRDVTPQDRADARASLDSFRALRPRREYMGINWNVLRPNWERIRTLASHAWHLAGDPFDETSRRPASLILDHSRQVFRGTFRRLSGGWETPAFPPPRPFVFFPLHKQPEASIDIMGSPFSNQLEIIRALARTLPISHDLYVKEHSVALNTRPASFYRELDRIPGVRLIGPFADNFELIAAADLVITVTGTAAYEAALLGRPAATIASVFFDRLVAYPRFDPFRQSLSRVLAGQHAVHRPAEEVVDSFAWILANSFPGSLGDPFWQPHSLDEANLEKVGRGFATLMAMVQESDSAVASPNSGHLE